MPISGGSNLLAVYSANASAVVLAFGGTNETLINVTARNPLESDAFYKGAFSDQGNGSVDPFLVDAFYGRIGGGYSGLYRVRCWHVWSVLQLQSERLNRQESGKVAAADFSRGRGPRVYRMATPGSMPQCCLDRPAPLNGCASCDRQADSCNVSFWHRWCRT